ncbi:MAG: hypothetical protein IKA19_08595 [Muribaculaceae bacterium]|nr:hypothetical protein [Muribaculaceae bacterium]MBR1964735.1 hypothetical protein [Muribaculaceae bacterium]
MKNVSTSSATVHSSSNQSVATAPRPKKTTLDFIRQFARSYHCEHGLNATLSGMIVN